MLFRTLLTAALLGTLHFVSASLPRQNQNGPYVRIRDGFNATSSLLGTGTVSTSASTAGMSSSSTTTSVVTSTANETNASLSSSSASTLRDTVNTISIPSTATELVGNATASQTNSSTSYITEKITSIIVISSSSQPAVTGSHLNAANISNTLRGTAPLGTGPRVTTANLTGMAYASSCNAAKLDWVSNIGQTYVSNSTFTTSTTSVWSTVTRSAWTETFLADPMPYTLCDGYPRLNGSTLITTLDTTPAITYTKTFITTTPVSRNVSAPTCIIPTNECAILSSEYLVSSSAFSSYIEVWNTAKTPIPRVPLPTPPICGIPPRPQKTSMTLGNAACAVNTASLRLLYWPVTTVSGDFCKGDGSTITPTPTIPGHANTVVYMNTTLTSPTVYMEFKGLWQVDHGDLPITSYQQTLLPMAPGAVSSRCGKIGGGFGPPMSMNYADLNNPVPASAYRCQPKCFTNDDLPQLWTRSDYSTFMEYATDNRCSTIWEDYNPALAVPPDFATVFPSAGFEDMYPGLPCHFILGDLEADGGLFFDPPIALQPASVAAGVTTPVVKGSSSTSATPSPDFNTPVDGTALTIPTPKSVLNVPSSNNSPTTPNAVNHASTTSQAAKASTTDQGLGGIIASVIGLGQTTQRGSGTSNTPASVITNPQAAPVVATITGKNGQSVTAVKSSNIVVVGSATIKLGATTEVPGVGTVVAHSDGVVIGGTTKSFNAVTTAKPEAPPVTIAGSPVTQDSKSQVIIGSITLRPGSQTVISGTTVSLGNSGSTLVVNGITQTLPPSLAATTNNAGIFTVNGETLTAAGLSAGVVISGTTLLPGSQTVLDGTTFSLGASGSALVVNGVTQTVQPTPVLTSALGLFTVDGQTITEGPSSSIVVAGITLQPGSQTVVSGTTISFDPSGTALVVNGATQTLQPAATNAGGIFTFDGQIVTKGPTPGIIISGSKVLPGHQTVIDGTTFSLDPSASTLVVDGTTQTLHTTSNGVFTVNGHTVTEGSGSFVVIDGTMLFPGHQTVIGSTTYSLDPSATNLVVNGATETLQTPIPGPTSSHRSVEPTGTGNVEQTGGAVPFSQFNYIVLLTALLASLFFI